MKKIIISIFAILVFGILWYAGSPLFINKKVNEAFPAQQTSATTTNEIVATGMFTGFDRLHNGTGTAKLLKINNQYVVRFEDDFEVTNGPDLYVGFGKDGQYKEGSEIAALKGNIGSQNYELPPTLEVKDFNEVWIWCKRFSVPFAKAPLVTN